ncbi:MAG: hypothetical protein R2862_08140 [Thermoanaerobaculia bacterium]
MTARVAVEQSYNLPTVRLALGTGLPRVVEMARGLGIQAPLQAVPSIALGSASKSRRSGWRRPTRPSPAAKCSRTSVTSKVLDRDGGRSPGTPVPPAPADARRRRRSSSPASCRGRRLRHGALGPRPRTSSDPIAGKTGTSNA